jgi:hypothetical protein
MHIHSALLFFLSLFPLTACTSRGVPPRDPGSPTPVAAGPGPTSTTPGGRGRAGGIGEPERRRVPVRPDQAPLVAIRDALEADSLLGRRVRVAGKCTAAGEGRGAGVWTLAGADGAIEVRGRVPPSCSAELGQDLTIFAQIEPKAAGSGDRLLLRLPD